MTHQTVFINEINQNAQELNHCVFWFIEGYQGGKKIYLFHFNITHVDIIIIANKTVLHTFISFDTFNFSSFSWRYFIMYQYIDLKGNSNSLAWPMRPRMIVTSICFPLSSYNTCSFAHTASFLFLKLTKLVSTSWLCHFSFFYLKDPPSAPYIADSFPSHRSRVNVTSPETSRPLQCSKKVPTPYFGP